MLRYATTLLTFAAILVFGLFGTAQAQAQTAQVDVIVASQDAGGVGAGLEVHAQRLTAQFATFSQFELVSSTQTTLAPSASVETPGGSVTLTLQPTGEITVAMPGLPETTIGVPSGSVHFQLGPAVPGGTLIIAIRPG